MQRTIAMIRHRLPFDPDRDIVCPLPEQDWAKPETGVILQAGEVRLIDALGYYVIVHGSAYEEYELWISAVRRFGVLCAR